MKPTPWRDQGGRKGGLEYGDPQHPHQPKQSQWPKTTSIPKKRPRTETWASVSPSVKWGTSSRVTGKDRRELGKRPHVGDYYMVDFTVPLAL